MRACDNPLSSTALSRLSYHFDEGDEHDVIRRLEAQRWRGALVGPEGSGKSTLLGCLEKLLCSRGFTTVKVILRSGGCRLHLPAVASAALRAAFGAGEIKILVIDGAEQMNGLFWMIVSRLVPRILITSHREGLLPTLYRCGTDERLLAFLLTELLGEMTDPVRERAVELFRLHRGNIRAVLWNLYDMMPDMRG
jgi:energy-coupling factor transporter ATP-binding protein EcfA2